MCAQYHFICAHTSDYFPPPMNRQTHFRLTAIFLLTLATSAFADVVTLKSGEKVEGKITAETAADITISVKTGGITDEQTIKKTDIASVSKDEPDVVAWQPLKALKLGKNSLPAASYDAAINPLNAFASEYPKSQFAAEAQKTADTFAAEKKRVEGGEVKMEDKWLSKDEAQKERYQINGVIALNYMKEQSTRDMIAALNTFDAIEKNFPGARAYPDAVEYVQKMLSALKGQVELRTKALAAQKIEREKSLAQLTGVPKTTLQDEIKREQAAADAAVSAAEKQGNKWLPLSPATERSLQSLASKISSEVPRLAAIPVAKMRASVASAEKAKAALEKRDFAAAEGALAQASSDWPANEIATRLSTELQSAKTAAATTAAAEPTAVAPVAAAPSEIPAAKSESANADGDVEVEKEKPFLLTPGGAITVVIAMVFLIVGINTFKKIKSKANDVLE